MTVDARDSPRRLEAAEPAALETVFRYDPVGNVTSAGNPRGVLTEIEVNALNEPVQLIRGAEVAAAAASGQLLTGEAPLRYRHRLHYDHNGRVVKLEIENRDGNTPGVGKWIAQSYTYDILDHRVERAVELDEEKTLIGKLRYDPNELLSLLIEPEGNQHAAEYDERDLPFLLTRGLGSAEASVSRLDYDLNAHPQRLLDAEDNDGDGEPEATWILRDGFDRAVEYPDPFGNRLLQHFDPNSSLVRSEVFGHPPNAAPGPGAAVLLADVSFHFDELNRNFQVDERLFVSEGFAPSGPIALEDNDGDGFVTTRLEHDRSSRRTFTVEDDGQVWESVYDGADRWIESRDQAGNRTAIDDDRRRSGLESGAGAPI